MESSESTSKIGPALVKAQEAFRAVAKSGENTFDRYKYADLEDYVTVVRPVLSKFGLAVVSSVDEVVSLEDRTTKNGGREHAARVKVALRIIHESGEWVQTSVWGEGQDRADKAVYKAITGARKYGLACTFGLATSDDPERDEQVGTDRPNQVSDDDAALADNTAFRLMLDEGFKNRGFTPEAADHVIGAVLKKKKAKDVNKLPLVARREFLDKLTSGALDHLKNPAPATAAN